MKCDYSAWFKNYCRCFSTISNNGMKPNSGTYNIKIKINKIYHNSSSVNSNVIGITAEKYDNNHEKLRKSKDHRWTKDSNYIGWSA